MTYNVFGGTLNLARSIKSRFAIYMYCYVSDQSAGKATGVESRGQISHFLTLAKIR